MSERCQIELSDTCLTKLQVSNRVVSHVSLKRMELSDMCLTKLFIQNDRACVHTCVRHVSNKVVERNRIIGHMSYGILLDTCETQLSETCLTKSSVTVGHHKTPLDTIGHVSDNFVRHMSNQTLVSDFPFYPLVFMVHHSNICHFCHICFMVPVYILCICVNCIIPLF